MKKVLGIGNALTDILIRLQDDGFLKKFSLPKGSMQLVDSILSEQISNAIEKIERSLVSGGSASNTIHGLAALGVETGFIGKVGKDRLGDFFEFDMKNRGITPLLLRGNSDSGRCISLISTDSERTMATYLGAAVELTADDISQNLYEGYDYFHIEGYLVQNRELIEAALKMAKETGLLVSLDLASYNVVEDNRDFLLEMTKKYVDILFANEEEAKTFTKEKKHENALEFMSEFCNISILKEGSKGSLISCNGEKTKISIDPVKSIDTTGAGDLYASGFLYGLINSLSIEKCGQIASLTAANVIQTIGSKISEEQWIAIKQKIEEIVK